MTLFSIFTLGNKSKKGLEQCDTYLSQSTANSSETCWGSIPSEVRIVTTMTSPELGTFGVAAAYAKASMLKR